MNPTDPLEQLSPLRDPALIGWWPLAPGWWLLLFLLLTLITVLAVLAWRRHRANAYRRQALALQQQHYLAWLSHGDETRYCTATNALLKRVAIMAFEGRAVAANSGQAWLEFLNSSCPAGAPQPPFQAEFAEALYRPEPASIDIEQLQRSAEAWIQRHRVGS